jgi:ribose transport system ATP-binding protein
MEQEQMSVLTLKNITKTYPGVIALNDVSLSFEPGVVHALMGENGAGKSTLIKVISGAIQPDRGTIEVGGMSYHAMTPQLSSEAKIAVIYQDILLIPALSVAENIYLGQNKNAFFSLKKVMGKATALLKEYGIPLDAKAPVSSLSPAQQTLVEIAKAISNDAKIMIMDEPTASLASGEVTLLFKIIRKLKSQGVAVIYISHRLDEVFEISDVISVLRDGHFIETIPTSGATRNQLIKLMVGRELSETYPPRDYPLGEVVLQVDHLTGNGDHDISFALHKGEILGVAGLVGSGRTEMAELITGVKPIAQGRIEVQGKPAKIHSPSDAISYGIGLIPEDRKSQGCILHNSVLFNTTMMCDKKYMTADFISAKKRSAIAEKYRQSIEIKTPSLRQEVVNLSGGNQQKVVVAKILAADLSIIFFDEPTKGIDVLAKSEIYALMRSLAKEGKAIVMISSDMEEVLGMSDRLLVLSEGTLGGELEKKDFSQERVLALASGLSSKEVQA